MDEVKEGDEFEVKGKAGPLSCTFVSDRQIGTLWEATVRCGNGQTKKATSANRLQAKHLACLECED